MVEVFFSTANRNLVETEKYNYCSEDRRALLHEDTIYLRSTHYNAKYFSLNINDS